MSKKSKENATLKNKNDQENDNEITIPMTTRRRSILSSRGIPAMVIATPILNRISTTTATKTPFNPAKSLLVTRAEASTKRERAANPQWDLQAKSWLTCAWSINFMSAMSSSFNVDDNKLREKFQKSLNNEIKDKTTYNSTVEITSQNCFLKKSNHIDVLVITVTNVILDFSTRSKKEDTKRVIYKAHLVRSDMEDQTDDEYQKNWYPLFFHNGHASVHNIVVPWLTSHFNCYVSRRPIHCYDLHWMLAIFAHSACKADDGGKVTLGYYMPLLSSDGWQTVRQWPRTKESSGHATATVVMEAKGLRQLAHSIIGPNAEVSLAGWDLFSSFLKDFVENITHIPAEALRLHSLKTQCVTLSAATSRIRISCRSHLIGILRLLKTLYFEKNLLPLSPDLDPEDLVLDEWEEEDQDLL